MRDYITILLLFIGLYLFINSDIQSSQLPSGTSYGLIMITIAMFCSTSVPIIQEYCMNKYNANVEELLFHSFLGSTVISFIFTVISGELMEGIQFISLHNNYSLWFSLIIFCIYGFFGSNFSTNLTLKFGSLINGITNTARKAVTLSLSFILFPNRNHITTQHIIGIIIFFCGLIVRIIIKDTEKKHKIDEINNDNNENENDIDIEDKKHLDTSFDNTMNNNKLSRKISEKSINNKNNYYSEDIMKTSIVRL